MPRNKKMKTKNTTLSLLSLSSMTLVLVATALYQHWSTRALLTPANPCAQYQRYDEALQLLYTNRPVAAAELIASFPDEKLVIINPLLFESSTPLAPAVLFLRIGSLLSRHAATATHRGSRAQALLLRDTLSLLQHRLERGEREDETRTERTQRLKVTQLLVRWCQRTTADLALTKPLPAGYSSWSNDTSSADRFHRPLTRQDTHTKNGNREHYPTTT